MNKRKRLTEEEYKYEVENKLKFCSSCKKYLSWDDFSSQKNARQKISKHSLSQMKFMI